MMERKVAERSDGVIAVVTSERGGWAYGHLLYPDGEKVDWSPPIASILGQGSWTVLPEREGVRLTPDD